MKTKIMPFDLETAKKIQAGEINGRIRTKEGDTARIICFDRVKLINGDGTTENQIVSLIYNENAREDVLCVHNQKGKMQASSRWQYRYDLVLEIPDNEPQFKPFDRVLVRDSDDDFWRAGFFSHYNGHDKSFPYFASSGYYAQCIPFEGNEDLVGTTNKPKED